MSFIVRPISPPVVPAKMMMNCCSSSTATSVARPKYGPVSRRAGTASTTPPSGAAADEKGGTKIHLVGEAEQEVPGHGEHAEVIGDGQNTEDIGRYPQGQGE